MRNKRSMISRVRAAVLLVMLLSLVELSTAQREGFNAKATASSNSSFSVNTEDLQSTREQLFKFLRMTPKLTMVLARDPSLLADEQYVSRSNPELEQFLQAHPEVVRNPEFYLFANLGDGRRQSREVSLEQAVWPELDRSARAQVDVGSEIVAPLVFLSILLSLLWLIRVLLENRRWTRVFAQQSEAQHKLFDKFGSGEELLRYMQSEAGRRLLEPMPIPANLAPGSQWNTPLARVITPFQFGTVLTLVGSGFLFLAGRGIGDTTALTIMGVLTLMVGVGLIISAVVSWAIGKHFGLLPEKTASRLESDSGVGSRQ